MRKISYTKEKKHFWPKYFLGQNFLVDQNIQKKIIQACAIIPQDTIIEIGAGRGELTRLIAEKTQKLFALEIDSYLCSILRANLINFPRVRIINENILRFNFLSYFKGTSKIKVIGNLPYNITTPIITYLLELRNKIEEIFVTVQKEFAQRMTATQGTSDWSAFSCFLQYYTEPKKLFLIKKTCFKPQPKVDSALVKLSVKKEVSLDARDEKELFKIVRLSFQQRRKTLKNALSGAISSKRLSQYLHAFDFDKNIRGEELSLQDFINLVNFK